MATTKTEQNIQKPTLPQSVIYRNLKQSIITAIKQSGLPLWVIADMLENITVSVQATSKQMMNDEMDIYNRQLKVYNEQEEKKKRSENEDPEE